MVSVAVITAFTSSYLFKHSGAMAVAIEQRFPEGLRASLALYQVWLKSLRIRGIHKDESGSLTKPIFFMLLDCLAMVGIFIVYRIVAESSTNWFGADPWSQILVRTSLAILLGLSTALFILGILKQSNVLARRLAVLAPNPEAMGSGRGGRHLLAGGIKIAILVIVGLPMVILMQAFIPTWSLFFVALTVFVLVMSTQIYRIRKLSRDIPLGTEWLLSRLFESTQWREESNIAMDRTGTFRVLRIGHECPSLGQRLSQLDLAGRAGVTVVALLRQGQSALPLHPSPEIQNGDRIVLAGPEHALHDAETILKGHFDQNSNTEPNFTEAR
jgi:hypothetical protein